MIAFPATDRRFQLLYAAVRELRDAGAAAADWRRALKLRRLTDEEIFRAFALRNFLNLADQISAIKLDAENRLMSGDVIVRRESYWFYVQQAAKFFQAATGITFLALPNLEPAKVEKWLAGLMDQLNAE